MLPSESSSQLFFSILFYVCPLSPAFPNFFYFSVDFCKERGGQEPTQSTCPDNYGDQRCNPVSHLFSAVRCYSIFFPFLLQQCSKSRRQRIQSITALHIDLFWDKRYYCFFGRFWLYRGNFMIIERQVHSQSSFLTPCVYAYVCPYVRVWTPLWMFSSPVQANPKTPGSAGPWRGCHGNP